MTRSEPAERLRQPPSRRHRPRRHQDRGDRRRRETTTCSAARATRRPPAAAPPTSPTRWPPRSRRPRTRRSSTRRSCAASASARPARSTRDAGTVARADNLPGWYASFPLAAALHSALGTTSRSATTSASRPTPSSCSARAAPTSSLLGVFWGTGVGGGLILDGKPWHGRGAAGEIGHTVSCEDGRRCPCGRRGCLEAYAGRAAMEARARKLQAQGAQDDPVRARRRSTAATASPAASGSARSSTTTRSRRS